jgi:hypothetical protein
MVGYVLNDLGAEHGVECAGLERELGGRADDIDPVVTGLDDIASDILADAAAEHALIRLVAATNVQEPAFGELCG